MELSFKILILNKSSLLKDANSKADRIAYGNHNEYHDIKKKQKTGAGCITPDTTQPAHGPKETEGMEMRGQDGARLGKGMETERSLPQKIHRKLVLSWLPATLLWAATDTWVLEAPTDRGPSEELDIDTD